MFKKYKQRPLPRNYASEHAAMFGLPTEPSANETPAEYREKIARTLALRGKFTYANEVLLNEHVSADDAFAFKSLDRGYGDKFITQMAQRGEASFQASMNEGCLPTFFKSFGRRGSKE